MTRKSEDLPGNKRCLTPWTRERQIQSAEKSGNPQIIYQQMVRGFFLIPSPAKREVKMNKTVLASLIAAMLTLPVMGSAEETAKDRAVTGRAPRPG